MPPFKTHLQSKWSLEPLFRTGLAAHTRAFYRSLWLELKRQRAALIQETIQEMIQANEATSPSDLLDQASVDQEQELSRIVKARSRDKLRQIDIALERMETRRYGLCLRCEQEIPFARLKVHPSALYCLPCQTVDESQQSTTKSHQHSHA